MGEFLAMANSMHTINLLPKKGHGFVDQFLSWALNIGRLLIILTETLALSVFIYRFSLDMKIVDLRDEIKQESAIVAQFKDPEATYRDLQARLSLSKEHGDDAGHTQTTFKDIIELGRGKITFNNLTVSEESVKIEAQAPNTAFLSAFINSLKNYPGIASVNIDGIENKTSSALIQINITAKLRKNS